MYRAIENVIKAGLKVVLVTNCKYGGVFAEYGGIGGWQFISRTLNVFISKLLLFKNQQKEIKV
jgi:hypothetical protein